MDKEKRQQLASLLGKKVIQEAVDEVCSEVSTDTGQTFEEMALRMSFVNGMLNAFNKLYDKAGLKRKATVLPRRLKPE